VRVKAARILKVVFEVALTVASLASEIRTFAFAETVSGMIQT